MSDNNINVFSYWNVVNGSVKLENEYLDKLDSVFDIFIFNRYVANDIRFIKLVLAINAIGIKHFDKKMLLLSYRSFYKKLYGNKRLSLKFNNKKENEQNIEIELVKKHFNITAKEAKEYLKVIDVDELQQIKDNNTNNSKTKIVEKVKR